MITSRDRLRMRIEFILPNLLTHSNTFLCKRKNYTHEHNSYKNANCDVGTIVLHVCLSEVESPTVNRLPYKPCRFCEDVIVVYEIEIKDDLISMTRTESVRNKEMRPLAIRKSFLTKYALETDEASVVSVNLQLMLPILRRSTTSAHLVIRRG